MFKRHYTEYGDCYMKNKAFASGTTAYRKLLLVTHCHSKSQSLVGVIALTLEINDTTQLFTTVHLGTRIRRIFS